MSQETGRENLGAVLTYMCQHEQELRDGLSDAYDASLEVLRCAESNTGIEQLIAADDELPALLGEFALIAKTPLVMDANKARTIELIRAIAEGVTRIVASPASAGVAQSGANPSWIAENQLMAVILAFVLIVLYTLPIYLVASSMWMTLSDGKVFQDGNFLLDWFLAFMGSADSTLNEFHKVLFPIMSAISIIVFRTRPTKLVIALGVFVLWSFCLTVFVSVVFDIPATVQALTSLKGVADAAGVTKPPEELAFAPAFFTRIQETLMMYLMMLLGIGVANTTRRNGQ